MEVSGGGSGCETGLPDFKETGKGCRSARAVALSQAYPKRSSGSKWQPSAHSFQAFMKMKRCCEGNLSRAKPATSANHSEYASGDEFTQIVDLDCRRPVLSQEGITPGYSVKFGGAER